MLFGNTSEDPTSHLLTSSLIQIPTHETNKQKKITENAIVVVFVGRRGGAAVRAVQPTAGVVGREPGAAGRWAPPGGPHRLYRGI